MTTSSQQLPDRAQIVIIGGGVIGSSVAYHLVKLGRTDVVLLERNKLTSGTTWHAAGLIVSGGMTSETSAWMARYTRELYERIEEETGLSTGFRPVGYVQTGASPDRIDKLRREADFLRGMGIEREEISAAEVRELWPMLDVADLIAGFYTANEGRADPANCAMSMAKGARMGGARIIEDAAVTGFDLRDGRVTGVRTSRGEIECDLVVNCGGMWARQIGAMAGVAVPLQAAEHAYLITDQIDSTDPDMPILEDPDRFAYYREETGGLMVGLFEPVAAPWSIDGVPDDFSFGAIPNDWDRLAPFLEAAMEPLPVLRDVGVRHLFTGPESFTPDNGSLWVRLPKWRTSGWRPGSIRSAFCSEAAPARSWPTGLPMGNRPSTSPRSTSPASTRFRPRGGFARTGPSNCSDGSTRPDPGLILIPSGPATPADRFSMTAWREPGHISVSRRDGRTPSGSLRPEPRSPSRGRIGDPRGGSTTRPNTPPPGTQWRSMTCPRCPIF